MIARHFSRFAAAVTARTATPVRAAAALAPVGHTRSMVTDIPKDQHIRLNLGVEFPNFEVRCITIATFQLPQG